MTKSIRYRWIPFNMVAVTAVAAGIVLFGISKFESYLIDRTGRELQWAAMEIAEKIDLLLVERYGDMKLIQGILPEVGYEAREKHWSQHFKNIQEAYPIYAWIGFVDKAGRVVASTDPAAVGKEAGSARWVGPVDGKRDITIQEIQHDELVDGQWTLSFATPVTLHAWPGRSGPFEGTLVTRIRFSELDEVVTRSLREMKTKMESREGMEYQVVNKQGQVLIKSRHLLEGTTNLINLGIKSAERATAGEAGFILEQHAHRSVEVLTGYAPIPEQKDFPKLGWGILVQVDHQTVLGPIRSLIQTVTFWGMAIFFPLWALLLWTMHRLRAEWHQTEAAQQASQELVNQKRTLLATVEAFFIQLNNATVVAEWTNQAERTFGITADEAIGKSFGGLVIAWDWHVVSEAIAQAAQNRVVVRLNKVVLSNEGERPRYLKLTLSPLKTNSGLDIVLMGEDITEYLALEHDLSQAQKLESLGQLAAGVAHEINTPTQFVGDNLRFLSEAFTDIGVVLDHHHTLLTSAKAGSCQQEAIERCEAEARRVDLEYLQEEVPKAIAQSFEGVERITKIVRAMKEFAHPGGEEAAYEDLNKAIQTTVEVSRNEWKYVAELTMDLAPDLPPVFCQLGPINQVVLNIIVNAAHAIGDVVKGTTQKGRITISTRTVGDGVEIRVRDTGGGIPETIRGKIFDPFFTTKPVGKGTGQGLAIARSVVVDKHGGRIDVESEVDQGTIFIIHLPVKPREAPSLREAA
ncbi:MAG: PAS domain S-box protein [Nitrospira sp.]|nr:PAS domain S-box protein [Nitrospira sp.]OYT21246.1 MAG: hypothetical protein CCU26_02240 [Nitrospira sp. UW-LDO-01]